MLQGSGVKNKLIEAMAAGLTVVTNSLGAEALPEEARQGVIIADGEENIANAVIYLLNNPEESLELAKKARVMAEKYFRWEALSQQLMTKLEEISQQINNV
jgi:glycosyltransferase involved in cell wall biosynthesis